MNKGLENVFKRILDNLINCDGDPYAIDNADYELIAKALKEHEQYKAIEQEIGIDLITLVKTLKNGCYVKPWKEIKYTYEIRTGSDNINLFLLDENDNDYSLKDYGKTWALTREELEK